MAAFLFGLLVFSSLTTSALIYFDVLAGSPLFLVLAVIFHVVIAIFFIRGYLHYRALHRLVYRGQGALFLIAVSNMIQTTRIRALRDHYRLQKCLGLVLTGQSLETLQAVNEYREHVQKARKMDRLQVLATEIEANLQLGQLEWSERTMQEARKLLGKRQHRNLEAVEARLELAKGNATGARDQLKPLTNIRHFPVTETIRSRNCVWLAQALERLAEHDEANELQAQAKRLAPDSHYGKLAWRYTST